MKSELEYRQFSPEIRAQGRTIEGYAALFDTESVPIVDFTEVIEPGTFARTLKRDLRADPILFLWDHEPGQPLASTKPGTLALSEDARGLAFSAQLPNTSWANDALEAVKAGLVGTSFGFKTVKDRWKGKLRHLVDVDLSEISLVTMPAYPATLGQQAVRSKSGRPIDRTEVEIVKLKLRIQQLR